MNEFPGPARRAINEDYKINIEAFISEAYETVRKETGLFMAFALVFMLISGALEEVPYVGSILNSVVISPCLTVGFYLAATKVNKGQGLNFEDFFKGFQYAVPLCIIGGAQFALSLMFVIPTGASLLSLGQDLSFSTIEFQAWTLVLLIPYFYFIIAWAFAPLFVVFYQMEAWPAMEASRRIISKKWGGFFLLFIVSGLVLIAGILAFCIGILFTFPICMVTTFVAFKGIVGLGEDEEQDLIDHLLS